MKKRMKNLVTVGLVVSAVLANTFISSAATDEEVTVDGTSSTQETEVIASKASEFTVTVPKQLVLDDDGSREYTITVVGDISGNDVVVVSPQDMYTDEDGDASGEINFYMSEQVAETVTSKKDDVLASIVQNKTTFDYAEVSATNDSGEVVGISVTGTVSTDSLSAGVWKGNFVFDIYLQSTATTTELSSDYYAISLAQDLDVTGISETEVEEDSTDIISTDETIFEENEETTEVETTEKHTEVEITKEDIESESIENIEDESSEIQSVEDSVENQDIAESTTNTDDMSNEDIVDESSLLTNEVIESEDIESSQESEELEVTTESQEVSDEV